MQSNIELFELEKIIKDIITIGNYQNELSFHTLTFNITENFTKENIQDLISKYTNKIHNMYLDNEFNKSYYIYTYEVSSELHIHTHLLLNKQCSNLEKKELIEYWNKLNNWEFYNKRGLLIKNNNEYTEIDLEELLVKEKENKELKTKNYALSLLLLKYIFKNIFNIEEVLKTYYMIYPINLVGGQKYLDFIEYIKKLNQIHLKTIYNHYKVYNPFLENIEEQEKLNYIYIKWKNYFKKNCNNLDLIFKDIQKEQDVSKKEIIIEQKILKNTSKISEIKLYAMGEKTFKIFRRILLLYLNRKIKENKHNIIILLEEAKNTIFYVLETLIKLIRYYKKDIEILKEEELEQENNLEKEFIYTESYFKSIMQKLYKTQLLNINLYKYKELYKNKDKNLLEKLEELKKEDNNMYLDLIQFYNENYNNEIEEKNAITNIYIYNHKKIEEVIGIWVVDVLAVLYEINVIEEINDVISINKERNQKYFSLTKDFLNLLMLESSINEIVPPLLIEPKNYELIEKEYKGGYLELSNILFSVNENLKYQMNSKVLDIINQTQKIPMYINKKYFNYILNNKISEIEKMVNLKLKNFEENYLDLEENQQNIKKIPEAFLIHEFFLTLYVAETFQNNIIWYISKLDERGRKYDVGYPLNFYRDKIFRNLFLLNKPDVLKNINEEIFIRNKNYKFYKDYINKIANDETYNKFNILNNPIECLVGFDAKNQIYQIIGGLIKDKKLLQLSHVIDLKTKYSWYDVYDYFLIKIRYELNLDQEFINIIEKMNKRIKNYEGSIKQGTKLNWKLLVPNNILFMLDRKWIKNILMTYGYNKGIPGLIQITFEKIFKNTWFVVASKSLLNQIITKIITKLISLFNTEIDTLVNLKLLFNGLISLSYSLEQPLYISIDTETGFYQYYTELETYSFIKWKRDGLNNKGKPKWKQIRISYINYKKIKKIKKGSNAILPNLCHYIDSILMYNVLQRLILDKIPIKTIHDSFYLNVKYQEYIYNIYYEEYIKIFKENILEKILINILIKFQINKDFNYFINKYKINIENILKVDLEKLKIKELNEIEKNIYNAIKKVKTNYEKIKLSENYIKEDLREFILNNKHKEIIK